MSLDFPGMTAPDDPPVDVRRQPRPRVAVRGQLLHGIHRECAEVVVRNLTEGGAKVRMTSTDADAVSPPLVLRVDAVERRCAIAWRAGDQIGLRFEPAADPA